MIPTSALSGSQKRNIYIPGTLTLNHVEMQKNLREKKGNLLFFSCLSCNSST